MRVFVLGDTVWKICLENGTTLDAFRAVNPEIRNLDYIQVSSAPIPVFIGVPGKESPLSL